MSAVPVLIELEKLAKEVTHTLEEFQKVSKNMDYYLLECSMTEEKYWMQKTPINTKQSQRIDR